MNDTKPSIRHVVGVMTGTSIDGIDAALVRILGHGLQLTGELVCRASRALGKLAGPLRTAAQQEPMTAGAVARLAWDFGGLHAEVIGELAAQAGHGLDLICVHGQTIFHQPPYSWQLINPAPITQRFKCPVVSDLRQADLAAGGQGAPITPIADWILFRDAGKSRAIVNLGGFCNVTILPAQRAGTSSRPPEELKDIRGFDVCACNQVLDAVARATLGKAFDENGCAAMAGHAKPQAAEGLGKLLRRQRSAGRSLGTGDETAQWVHEQQSLLSPNDLASSAVQGIARCIHESIDKNRIDEAIIAGGGGHNRALIEAIKSLFTVPVLLSSELGVPIEARESMCFAILGALCADGVPITLPQVTGCREPAPISGVWMDPTKRQP